jgi:CheY-like chemotaxis protein
MNEFRRFLEEHAAQAKLTGFQHLMKRRVQEILLVSSPYDSYVLAEDGKLEELMLSEFLEHNLSHAPGVAQVASGAEALELAKAPGRFDLVIMTPHIEDMAAAELARRLRVLRAATPLILLTYDRRELADVLNRGDAGAFDRIFNWQGDFRIFLTIVKQIEDVMNVEPDNRTVGVQVVILVEDDIRYYSSYLPMFYAELFRQSQKVIAEGPSLSQKVLRMRARPKILLACTFDEAVQTFEKYRKDVLGIISDVRFPRGAKLDDEAGIELVKRARAARPDLPVLLQSSQREHAPLAAAAGASFLWKESPTLLEDLRAFMVEHFAFGDFVFRTPDGEEVARARDLKELEEGLERVPDESLLYHAERDHFSVWLKARTEFLLADRLKPHKVSEYESIGAVRRYLIDSLHEHRLRRYRGAVVDFNPADPETLANIARIGTGSIGGKARGLAFVSMLLNRFGVRDRFPGVRIFVPRSVVLCTDVFRQFVEENDLAAFALTCADDDQILARFLAGKFPGRAVRQLRAFLGGSGQPLAVRSSSLFEDSLYQPFAGVYRTHMIPNNHPKLEVRLRQLLAAVKSVYASTYQRAAKDYVRSTSFRLEEEQMAVIVERVIGNRYGDRHYPHFSGVARSHNSYPAPPASAEDGVAALALGLGQEVVGGGAALQFCPRYPRHPIGLASPEDYLRYTQREFFAVNLSGDAARGTDARALVPSSHGLDVAERDGVLLEVCSTYDPQSDALADGASREGPRVVSFAPILKYGTFPLPEILSLVLDMGRWGMNAPVEIEFAVNLGPQTGGAREFGVLQMRPLALHAEAADLRVDLPDEALVCRSPRVLGNGRIDAVRDLVFVDPETFDRARSSEVAEEIARHNARLAAEGAPYILIGVGRWGSADPWLGIPVQWGQISGVKAVVEAGFRDFRVTPSQGSHFFQNLVSFSIGYFTVNEADREGFVDWSWLRTVEPAAKETFTRHLRFERPLVVTMNGRKGDGVIAKPGRG